MVKSLRRRQSIILQLMKILVISAIVCATGCSSFFVKSNVSSVEEVESSSIVSIDECERGSSNSLQSTETAPLSSSTSASTDNSSFRNESSMTSDFEEDYSLCDSLILNKIGEFVDTIEGLTTFDSFLFFTDPHNFSPNNSYDYDEIWFKKNFSLIKAVSELSQINTVVCGGDMLNNNDSKEQAFYKLNIFADNMERYFSNSHIIVGNHDTNYQGDTYMATRDYISCKLSLDEIRRALFNGGPTYYYFSSETTTHYCFDSGIDWDGDLIDEYRSEQLLWFAEKLLSDKKEHKTILIHIGIGNYYGESTAMMNELGKIIESFNDKKTVYVNDVLFDYSKSNGYIDFIQSGHIHWDVNSYSCGNIPIIVTRTFSSPEVATQPTFDLVLADYDNHLVRCFRIGDGQDRTFLI